MNNNVKRNSNSVNRNANNVGNKGRRFANKVKRTAASHKGLLIGLLVLVLVIIMVSYLYYDSAGSYSSRNPILIGHPTNAFTGNDNGLKSSGYTLPRSTNPYNFTYSFWVYVSDWNYKFKQWKNIFIRQPPGKNPTSIEPGLYFYPMTNAIHARISTTQDPNEGCDIKNIPLQKWVHIAYVLNTRNVDMYVDGKLERSCVLKGIPVIRNNSKVFIAKNGGFYGQIARFQFFNSALQPDDVLNIYSRGPYEGRKYNVKMNFFKGGHFVNVHSSSTD